MKRVARLLMIAAMAVALAPCDAATALQRKSAFEASSSAALEFGAPPPDGIGGPIDLVDDQGRRFTNARLLGRPAVLFFGFTHCGITCPVALAAAKQLLAQASVMHSLPVVFVTLDPLNDNVAALHRFLSNFDPRLIGLTGSPTQIEDIADRFGVATRRVEGRLEHSSMWYLLDGSGRVRRVYGITTPAPQLAADFNRLARENSGGIR
jgi:protein SCO1/2